MPNIYDILSSITGKSSQNIKGNTKELQLDILTRLISTLTFTNAKTLRNIYVPYSNGTKTTEIDMLLLANGNIYIFEVKNYSCTIVGTEQSKSWNTIYTKEKTYDMYNPIMQNKGHISTLASYLKLPESCFKSVIVFSENANIGKVKYTRTNNLSVLTMDMIIPYLIKQKASKKLFNDQQIKYIYDTIKPLTKVSNETKEKHIQDVKSKK